MWKKATFRLSFSLVEARGQSLRLDLEFAQKLKNFVS